MFSLSSSLFTAAPTEHQWRSHNNSINHDQNPLLHFTSDRIYDSNFLHFPPPQPQVLDPGLLRQGGSGGSGGDSASAKKLNHNASERDRRKKINYLYNSLRSLLPTADQLVRLEKKPSNPATISRVVKYIPELQQQVEALTRKKEEIKARIRSAEEADEVPKKQDKIMTSENCFWTVFTNRLSEKEILIQVSTKEDHHQMKNKVSEMLVLLENDGLLLLHASSFSSLQGRLFLNLHIQVDGNYPMAAEALRENLLRQATRKY